MGSKGIVASLLEEANNLPIEAILFEHEERGMQLEINDGLIIDLVYDTKDTLF